MKNFTLLLFAICSLVNVCRAQTPLILPLQPEKLAYAREVEQKAIAENDTLGLAEAYYLYGKIHVAALDFLGSRDFFMKSLRIVERRKLWDKVARIYVRLSDMEINQSNLPKANEYARLALARTQAGQKRMLVAAYHALSNVYLEMYKDSLTRSRSTFVKDSLTYYCSIAQGLAMQKKDTLTLAATNLVMGEFFRIDKNKLALEHYQKALDLYTAIKHPRQIASTTLQLALSYLSLNDPQKAYAYLKEADAKIRKLGDTVFNEEIKIAEAYMLYYAHIGNWSQAFKYSLQLKKLENDRLVADRNGAVSRLNVEYDTQQKEAELQAQRRELDLSHKNQQIQQRLMIMLAIMLVVTALASVLFYRLFRKNRRLSRRDAILVKEQNHRVKNNLQIISGLLTLQSNRLTDENARNAVEDSQRRIEVMGLLQRKLYDGDELVTINLDEYIRDLTEMVLETFEMNHVVVSYDIPQTVLSADYLMHIGLIVNELITNSCKHAFDQVRAPMLWIKVHNEGPAFRLWLRDNGPGTDMTSLSEDSFGVRLIRMQVEQLYASCQFRNEDGLLFEMAFETQPTSKQTKKILKNHLSTL